MSQRIGKLFFFFQKSLNFTKNDRFLRVQVRFLLTTHRKIPLLIRKHPGTQQPRFEIKTFVCLFVCLCWGLTSQSTIFSVMSGRSHRFLGNKPVLRGVKCLAQGHNTAAVGFEPPTSRSGVRHSTTEPPRSPKSKHAVITRYPGSPSDLV